MKWHCDRRSFSFCAGLLLIVLSSVSGSAATPDEIDTAIEKGQKFLLSQQKPTGQWENDLKRVGTGEDWGHMQGDTFGGFTALATYALLASGQSPTSPEMSKAIDFLRHVDLIGIYALGLRANVWLLIPETAQNAEWRESAIHKDRDLLLNSLITGVGPNEGLWGYKTNRRADHVDHSVSQYGVLGLWACEQAGAEVPLSTWELMDRHWRLHQFPDGRWEYDGTPTSPGRVHKDGPEPSMVAAGIATLFITQDYIFAAKGSACNGNISNENIDKGMAWMSANFGRVNELYTMYGIERIGVASGRKYFGDHDWFAEISDKIVKSQKPDGSWQSGFIGGGPLTSTSYALLFLTRGQAPVMVNKLQYKLANAPPAPAGSEGHWNQRPRDVANVIRFFIRESENDLNWQIVSLSVPATELAEAPVLYISGDTELSFTPGEMQKLRDFVYLGGIIFGNADCGSEAFASSFEKLGTTLFHREFRDLPQNHPIYTLEQYPASRWKDKPEVLGLSNGIREFMLLVPQADAGRAWHVRADRTHAPEFQLGANVFMYAVDKSPSVKGRTHIVEIDPKIVTDRALRIARLQVGDNWDPEPGAWNRMAAVLHNQARVAVTVSPVKLAPGSLADFKVAHLTGTTKIKFTDDQRAALLEWIGRGGTLIIDAAGGSSDFADSIETELKTTFGADAEKGLADTLQPDHPMFGLPKMAIQGVTYRPYARNVLVGDVHVPRIRAIEHNGRVEVFYSREDITEGMVGQKVDGVDGYSPQSATDLMRNMVIYAGFTHRHGG
jgi:hypothetical protein